MLSFWVIFSKNNSLVGAMDRVVSQWSMFVCHTNQVWDTIRTNEIAVYKGEVIWHSCKWAISFEDFRFVGGGIGKLWINPGFETLACLQRTRRQQKTQH